MKTWSNFTESHSKFDVCLVIVALAVVGSVIEAATPSLAGYFVGFTLNLVGTMSMKTPVRTLLVILQV